MNDTRKRDMPATATTKREEVAKAALVALIAKADPDLGVQIAWYEPIAKDAVRYADALFDALEYVPELAHAYDEPDFDHESTP